MKIKKNGKVIRLTESDLKKIVKRVLNEQPEMEEFEGELFARRLPPNIGMGHTLDDGGTRVEVIANNGFDAIEDKEAIQIMTGGGRYVRVLPNLMAFPNLFLINFSNSAPLRDIDVDSIINNKSIARVTFNYEDSPIMNSKVNELENRAEELGMIINANKVEREPRR